MIDDLIALRLQLEWGVDEVLGDAPVDRFAQRPSAVASRAPPVLDPEPAILLTGRVAPSVQAQTLEALHAELDAFTACPLRATATHTVRPSGAADASILLIGDAPGSEDDRSGQAFSGPPGALLDRVLASIGLDRQRMLLTTLVPWRPPGNRPASESEIAACLPFVHRLIDLVGPRVIVLLGAGPVAALTGTSGTIRQLRGRWLDVSTQTPQNIYPALPVLPLAQWLRDATTKQQLWSDLMLLDTVIRTG